MTRQLGLFFAIFSLYFQPAFASVDHFCVQGFNAYGPAYASNKTERMQGLGATLDADSPLCDSVQLQELWEESQFQLVDNLLAPFHYNAVFSDSTRNDGFKTGLAMFYQGHVLQQTSERYVVNNVDGPLDLGREIAKVGKAYAFTTVNLTEAHQDIFFINTHTHPTSTPVRVAQMLQLIQGLLTKLPIQEPMIFAADMNATPDSLEVRLLENVLLLSNSYLAVHGTYGTECTYCANNPLSWSRENRVIDYILYKNSKNVLLTPQSSEINLREYNGAPMSDHYGMRSHFAVERLIPGLF